jgi:hypothetical protein
MCFRKHLPALLALALVSIAFGCGKKAESTGLDPNTELNEEQKQQVNDLNQQRQEEWKTTPKR